MTSRPGPSPEGELLHLALQGSGLSIREAARRAGISEGRWRQIVNGYQNIGNGVYAPVRNVPAGTIARMAAVFTSVTPERLTAAGREDAAAILAEASEGLPAERPASEAEDDLRRTALRHGATEREAGMFAALWRAIREVEDEAAVPWQDMRRRA